MGYRIFLLKPPTGFLMHEEFQAVSDEIAVARARDMAKANPYSIGYEVWDRARLVHREVKKIERA